MCVPSCRWVESLAHLQVLDKKTRASVNVRPRHLVNEQVQKMRNIRTRLACCRGAHGPSVVEKGGPGPSPRVKSVLFFFLGFCCVFAPLSHPTFLLFASGVILELQAVLGWSIRSASTHHFSAATRKLLRIGEEMTARSGPLFWRSVMTDGYHCHSTRAVCCDSSDRGIEICQQI